MKLKSLAVILNRPLSKLVLGSVGGYAIVLFLSPLVTRVYTPEEFGQFAIFSGFVAVASVFMSLSLELGILSAKGIGEARRYAFLSVVTVLCMTLIVSLAVLLLGGLGVDLHLPTWALALAVLSCTVASLTSVAINWCIYARRPSLAARSVFASLSGRSVMQVGLGYGIGGLFGLVVGEVGGRLLALLAATGGQLVGPVRVLTTRARLTRADLADIRPYGLYITPSAAIDTALVWLPAPLFSIFFDPFVGGLVAMTQRLGSVLLTISNQSIGQLFHRRTSEKLGVDNSYLFRFLLLYFGGLLFLTVVAVLLLFWQGETVFGILLGSAWSGAYFAAIALAPLYLFQFVSLLSNRVILVGGRAYVKLLSSVAQLAALFATMATARWMDLGWETALFSLAACLALVQGLTILYALQLLLQSGDTESVTTAPAEN